MKSIGLLLATAVLIFMKSISSEGYRILAVVPLNGKSHFTMCEQLFKGLARDGHQVDVISHFPLKKPIPNYRDLSLQGTLPDVVNNMTYNVIQHFITFNMKRFTSIAGDPVCELLGHPVLQNIIKNPPTDPPYDAVIIELFASNCYMALGRHLKIPMIGLVTATWFDWLTLPLGNLHSTAVVPSAFSKMSHPMSFWERLGNTYMFIHTNLQFHYYMEQQLTYVHKYIGKEFSSIYDLYQDLSLVLINSHYSLNGVKPYTPTIVEVGGLHVTDEGQVLPPQVEKWLNDSKDGCVYMSFGSMVKIESFPKETLEAFYKTFAKLAPVRFLLKIPKKEELPPGLPENVMTYPWLPQVKVLKHKNTRVFVTHGGLMGTLESIAAGVPMVGIPLFGDQHVNINNYVRQRFAVHLDLFDINEKTFTEALKTVLTNPVYRQNIERISQIYVDRPMSPLETAKYWVNYAIKHKNALKSPAMTMSWWQVLLLDVYAFIALCLFVIIFVFWWTVKLIFRLCCRKQRRQGDVNLRKKEN